MIPPTKLYDETTFIYIILIIFQYNDNYKNKANSICSYPGDKGHVWKF